MYMTLLFAYFHGIGFLQILQFIQDPFIVCLSFFFCFVLFCFVSVFCFLGPHQWPVEVPRLGLESELQLPAYSNLGSELCLQLTPQLMAMPDPQPTERGQGLNPHPHSWIRFCCTTTVTPRVLPFSTALTHSFQPRGGKQETAQNVSEVRPKSSVHHLCPHSFGQNLVIWLA